MSPFLSPPAGKWVGIIICSLVYSAALVAAVLIFMALPQSSVLLRLAAADAGATVVVFAASMLFGNSSLYDPYWSVAPLIIAMYWILTAGVEANGLRQTIVMTGVCLWSIRLTLNWVRGWRGLKHEDWRYRKLSADTGGWYPVVSLFGIHLFPTVLVFLGCLPLWLLLKSAAPLTVFDAMGSLVLFGGITIQFVADEQLRYHRILSRNGQQLLQSGVWSWSRHPNYLGEVLFWTGLFLFVPGLPGAAPWWTATGFLSMFALFWSISIPLMEKRLASKHAAYSEYRQAVPALLPFIKFGPNR